MAKRRPSLSVKLAPRASEALRIIWRWNAEKYGERHADEYVRFLNECIRDLSHASGQGKPVPHRPDLRYIVMRKKPKGHGHIAAYSVVGGEVRVSHSLHTAQDWQNSLSS